MSIASKIIQNYVEHSLSDEKYLTSIRNNLSDYGLYDPGDSVMGGDPRGIISSGITRASASFDSMRVANFMDKSLEDLKLMCETTKERNHKIWYGMISILGLGILIPSIFSFFGENVLGKSSNIFLVVLISALLLIIAAAYFYRRNENRLHELENERIKLNRMLIFFKLIDGISDPPFRDKAFNDLLLLLR